MRPFFRISQSAMSLLVMTVACPSEVEARSEAIALIASLQSLGRSMQQQPVQAAHLGAR